jgi:hypothetical protein
VSLSIPQDSSLLAPRNALGATKAVQATSPAEHARYAALFPGTDTHRLGDLTVVSFHEAQTTDALLVVVCADELRFEPPTQATAVDVLSALAEDLAPRFARRALMLGGLRSGLAALRPRAGRASGAEGGETSAAMLDLGRLQDTVCAHLGHADRARITAEIRLLAAALLSRLGRLAAVERGIAIVPRMPLDLELVHHRLAHTLAESASGIPGADAFDLTTFTTTGSS